MTYQQKMEDYAEQQGWGRDLSALTASQYQKAAKAVRPMSKLLKDGAAAVTSLTMTKAGVRTVSDEVVSHNRSICQNCPHGMFMVLENKEPVCNECNCSSKWLRSKWKWKHGHCPKGEWDNRTI